MRRPARIAWAAGVVASSAAGSAAAQVPHVTVAASGLSAPGGAVFGRPIQYTWGSAAPQVLFAFTVPDTLDLDRHAVFAGPPGDLRVIARAGGPAPGAAVGVGFEEFYSLLMQDSAGRVAFDARLAAEETRDEGVFHTPQAGGPLIAVALEGQQAPGMPPGVAFSSVFDPVENGYAKAMDAMVLSPSAGVIFRSTVVGPGAPVGINGVWYGHNEQDLKPLLLPGAAVPGLPPEERFAGGFNASVNDAGQFAMTAHLQDAKGTPRGVVLLTGTLGTQGASISPLLRIGDAAPGISAATAASGYSLYVHENGAVTFAGTVSGPGVTLQNESAVWTTRSGSVQLLTRGGDMLPGSESPLFDFIPFGPNQAGDIAGVARLWTGSENAPLSTALYVFESDAAAPRLVVADGQQAPGAPAGLTFRGIMARGDVNDAGMVAFDAALRDPANPVEPVYTSWLTDADGTLHLLASEGDWFTVAPGDVRRVGTPTVLSLYEDGRVLMAVDFADGSSGIFVTAVPEPGVMSIAGGAVIVLGGRRRAATRDRSMPRPYFLDCK